MSDVLVSTVVTFGDGVDNVSEYLWLVEPDEEMNDYKTSFYPGDQIVLRVNHSANVSIDQVVATDGSIQQISGMATRIREDEVLFSSRDTDEPTSYRLSVIPKLPSSIIYKGRLGALTKSIPNSDIVEYSGDVSKTPFRANFITNYSCSLFRLYTPVVALDDGESYIIDVVFYITVNR